MATNSNKTEQTMNKLGGAGTSDRIEGNAKKALGKTQETLGSTLDNPQLQERGLVNQTQGEAQVIEGEFKGDLEGLKTTTLELLSEATNSIRETAHEAMRTVKEAAQRVARKVDENSHD